MLQLKKFREWSKLSKRLFWAGVLWGVLATFAGLTPFPQTCGEGNLPGCWYAEKIAEPLARAGLGFIAAVLLFPSVVTAVSSLAVMALTDAVPRVLEDGVFLLGFFVIAPLLGILFAVLLTEAVGHIIAFLWKLVFRRHTSA